MNYRQKLIQLIHVARGKTSLCSCGRWIYGSPCPCGSSYSIRMDEDAYRAFLEGITGKSSAADMDTRELETVLEVFRKKGFQSDFVLRDYMSKEKRAVISSISARGRSVLGEDWENRVNGFLRKTRNKESLRFCTMPELRAVQGFINRIARVAQARQ